MQLQRLVSSGDVFNYPVKLALCPFEKADCRLGIVVRTCLGKIDKIR